MINEFDGETFHGVVIVNENVGSTTIGTVQGTKYLAAQSLPRATWGSNQGIMAFDILILFVFAFLLDMIGLHFQEKSRSWYFNQIRRPRANVYGKVTSEDLEAQSSGTFEESKYTIDSLSVKNLCYSVNIGKKGSQSDLALLNDVTARFAKGRMCALMGQSGYVLLIVMKFDMHHFILISQLCLLIIAFLELGRQLFLMSLLDTRQEAKSQEIY